MKPFGLLLALLKLVFAPEFVAECLYKPLLRRLVVELTECPLLTIETWPISGLALAALAAERLLAAGAVVDGLFEFLGVSACFVCRADVDEGVNFGSLDTGAVVMTAVGIVV